MHKSLKNLSSVPNQANQKQQKLQGSSVHKRNSKTRNSGIHKLNTKRYHVVIQPQQPHIKKTGYPLTTRRIEHGTLKTPQSKEHPYYPICYTYPPLLVSVATNCLNREGLEPKATDNGFSHCKKSGKKMNL